MRRFWTRYWTKGTRPYVGAATATETCDVPTTCAGCNKSMASLCQVSGMVFPLPPSPRCCGHQEQSPLVSRTSTSGFSDWSSLADRPSRTARLRPKWTKSMHGLRSKVGRLSL